jgi:PTS system fructose-specific IIA component/PTS system nitrogen regulatory IIA component
VDEFAKKLDQAAERLGFLRASLPDGECSAEAAVRYLISRLVQAGLLAAQDAESTTQAVLKREWLGSTNFGKGVAIPHAVVSSVKRVTGALGRREVGLTWDSPSDTPVFGVYLVLAPPDRPADHMRALEYLSSTAR